MNDCQWFQHQVWPSLTGTANVAMPACPGPFFNMTHNRLSGLYLPGELGLKGTLPEALGQLQELTSIEIHQQLTGAVPYAIAKLEKLEKLDLLGNQFTSAPQTLPPRVKYLNLAFNQLDHSLYQEWTLLPLETLDLSNNQMVGEWPRQFPGWSRLSRLDVSFNNFNGSLPQDLTLLSELTSFKAESNQFSGPLPSSVKTWAQLAELMLNNNQFIGSLPTDLGTLNLFSLYVQGNPLSGPVPSTLARMVSLYYCDLSQTNLCLPKGLVLPTMCRGDSLPICS